MSLGAEDTRRAVEAAHDVDALDSPESLSPHPQEQAALHFSRAELVAKFGTFKTCAAASLKELGETQRASVALQSQRDVLIAYYARAQHSAQALVLDDPDEPLPGAELERRQRLIDKVFSLGRGALRDLAVDKLHAQLVAWQQACEQDEDLKPLKLTREIKPHITKLGELVGSHQKEAREDREAQEALNQARAALDVAHRAHALQVEAALVRAGKRDIIGRYILARDAAYAARRSASKPIVEEPGAEDALGGLPLPVAEAT